VGIDAAKARNSHEGAASTHAMRTLPAALEHRLHLPNVAPDQNIHASVPRQYRLPVLGHDLASRIARSSVTCLAKMEDSLSVVSPTTLEVSRSMSSVTARPIATQDIEKRFLSPTGITHLPDTLTPPWDSSDVNALWTWRTRDRNQGRGLN
jgi:hypothetical protein